jgi:hypothetical protein
MSSSRGAWRSRTSRVSPDEDRPVQQLELLERAAVAVAEHLVGDRLVVEGLDDVRQDAADAREADVAAHLEAGAHPVLLLGELLHLVDVVGGDELTRSPTR